MPIEQPPQEKDHTLTLCCVYANVDEPFQQAVAEHLGHLGQNRLPLEWYHRSVTMEMDWTVAFDSHINTASIILVLLSSDLFLSDYCYSREMQRACERHTLQEAFLIPLLLHPVDWQGTLFAQLHLSPLHVSSTARWSHHGEEFLSLIHRIDAAIQHFQKPTPRRIPHPSFPIWHVPSPRNDLFTGHEETLTQLSTLLAAHQRLPDTQLYALCGPGGIGKTEIAREYAYRFRHHYLLVFWLRADTPHTLISAFVTLAECLDIPEHSAHDKMQAVSAVKNWLGRTSGWLLILDDVLSLPSLKAFLPETWSGHILLTTHVLRGEKDTLCIRVEPMTPQVGGAFLLRQRTLSRYAPSETEVTEEDRDLAEEIAREAKGFPLALSHTGAYLSAAAYSIRGYLSLYRRERTYQRKHHGDDFANHLHPVAITFANAFEDIEKWHPAGADMLRVCAFLSPHAIPEELIFRGAVCLGLALQSLARDDAKLKEDLNALCEYALLTRDTAEQTLSIHRLVQGLLKEEMDPETYRDWARRTLQAMNKTFPKKGTITWEKCQRWLPHVLICAEHIESLQIIVPEAVQLLHRAGNYASECGLDAEAELLLRQALSLSEKTLGVQHGDTMKVSKSLADLLEKRTHGV